MDGYQKNESDLIPVFRYFSWYWLAFSVLLLFVFLIVPPISTASILHSSFYIIHAALLAAFLQTKVLRTIFREWYLLVALFSAVGGVLLISYLTAPRGNELQNVTPFTFIVNIIRQVALLIVSTILIGARYRLRWMFFYVIALCALLVLSYSINIFYSEPQTLIYIRLFYLLVGCTMTAVGYLTWQLSQAERQKHRALMDAHAKLERHVSTLEELTISRERNRMARELHDTLAHTLSGLAVQLETARVYARSDAELSNQLLEQSVAATRSGLQETRRALEALRARPLEDLGLVLALEELAKSAQARMGTKLVLELPDDAPLLSSPEEQCIYRVAQEAIANVVKHATARTLTVRLSTGNEICLVVHDDGVGFDAGAIVEQGHYGLAGMRERAALANGTVRVESQVGRGTNLTLIIRYTDQRHKQSLAK